MYQEPNLENIHEGMVAKNYPAMCELLCVEEKGGKSKKLQIEDWRRYFDFNRRGHKFAIGEVYEHPLPKDFHKKDVYTEHILAILRAEMKDGEERTYSMKQLLKLFGFVNGNWDDEDTVYGYTSSKGLTPKHVKFHHSKLYSHIDSYGRKAICRCLGRISERKLFRHSEILLIQADGNWRDATPDEMGIYKKIAEDAKGELGARFINLFNRNEYYGIINKKIGKYGWTEARKLFRITPVLGAFGGSEGGESRREALEFINNHCVEIMLQCAERDLGKEALDFVNDPEFDPDFILSLGYPELEKSKSIKHDLIDLLVRRKRTPETSPKR